MLSFAPTDMDEHGFGFTTKDTKNRQSIALRGRICASPELSPQKELYLPAKVAILMKKKIGR